MRVHNELERFVGEPAEGRTILIDRLPEHAVDEEHTVVTDRERGVRERAVHREHVAGDAVERDFRLRTAGLCQHCRRAEQRGCQRGPSHPAYSRQCHSRLSKENSSGFDTLMRANCACRTSST